MTLKKAIERIKWRFQTTWKPNVNDLEALNTIIEQLNNNDKRYLKDNETAFKLYMICYSIYLDKYKATVFDDIPRKELNRLINAPIELIVKKFTDKLNKTEFYEVMDKHFDNKHPAEQTDEERRADAVKLKNLSNDEKRKFLERVWDEETVLEALQFQFNNIANR